MSDVESWTLTFTPLRSTVPVDCRVRQLLKYALRACRLKLTGYSEPEDVARLKQIVEGLADLVSVQAELLERRAEKGGGAAGAEQPRP